MFSAGAYDGMHVIYEALKKTGGKADGDSLIAAAKGMAWESPRGPMSIDPETRDVMQTVYIRRVEKVGDALHQRRVRQGRERQGSGEGSDEELAHVSAWPSPGKRRIVGRADDRFGLRRAVRRLRLRDAAVPALGRAVGDARHDEFRQPGALQLRHARRLCHGDADQRARLAVPGHAAVRLPVGGGGERGVRARALSAALSGDRSRPVPAHDRDRVHLGRRRRLCLRHHPAAGDAAGLPARHRLDHGAEASASTGCS